MTRTAKTIIGVLAALVAALVGFIVWAAVTPAPTADASKYPGVTDGSPGEAYLDALANYDIPVDQPLTTIVHGDTACQHISAGDDLGALEYLTYEAGYSQDERVKVHIAATMHLCGK